MKNSIQLISVFAVVVLLLGGCKKDGPVTLDSIPPTIALTITGGGYTKTFNQTDDYSLGTLNLKSNTKYNVICTLADTGGVKLLQITLPKLLTSQVITGVPNDTVYSTTLDYSYRVNTYENDPYKSSILSGSFTTPDAANVSYSFSISAVGRDFNNNRSTILFNASVDNNPVGGYGWVLF
jgi:hypothetical protein